VDLDSAGDVWATALLTAREVIALADALLKQALLFTRPPRRARRSRGACGWVDLDAELLADHEVRAIAAVIDKLDLRGLYADVRARSEDSGAPAADPKIRLRLCGYATSDGVGA
jgi:hypothetical protein